MSALGVDLSLSGTGVAVALERRTWKIKPPAVSQDAALDVRVERHRLIRAQLYAITRDLRPSLVVIEGPSYSSKGGHEHERGGLWWRVVTDLLDADQAVVVATPSMIKKFATGRGGAGKDEVLSACVRRFDWFSGGNDEADATWLSEMGNRLLGRPTVDLPAVNLTALRSWPPLRSTPVPHAS